MTGGAGGGGGGNGDGGPSVGGAGGALNLLVNLLVAEKLGFNPTPPDTNGRHDRALESVEA
jgi:hypothetical protein